MLLFCREFDDVVVCTGNHCHCCSAGRSREGNFVGRRGPNKPGWGLRAWLRDGPEGMPRSQLELQEVYCQEKEAQEVVASVRPFLPLRSFPERFLRSIFWELDLSEGLVGAPRFELGTPSPPDWCANRAALRSAAAIATLPGAQAQGRAPTASKRAAPNAIPPSVPRSRRAAGSSGASGRCR